MLLLMCRRENLYYFFFNFTLLGKNVHYIIVLFILFFADMITYFIYIYKHLKMKKKMENVTIKFPRIYTTKNYDTQCYFIKL